MINDLTMVFNPITHRSIELFASWVIFHASFGRLLIFFKINFFEKFLQEYHLSVKQIGSILSGLIWVQTVCKSYQQMTLGDKE